MPMASIGRSSAVLASGTIVSRVLGFVNIAVLIVAIGGFGRSADSFAVANQLPNNVYMIVAGGVLNAVLVPQIVRAAQHADGGRGYINKLLTLSILVLGAITVLATLLAPILVRISASQLSQSQLELATIFAYFCLPQIFFYGLYSLLGEVLNARNSFGPFTWAPVLNNVISIAGYGVFIALFGADQDGRREIASWTGSMIATIGLTATIGIAVQALVLFLFWRRVGLKFRLDFHWRGVGLRTAGRMAGWTFGMLLITQLAGLVDTNVASIASGQDASINVLSKSWLVFMLPLSIITVSIGTVYFTRMSEHGSMGRIEQLKADLSVAARTIALLIVLADGVLIVAAYPFARLFVSEWSQTQAMGTVIIAYLFGLLPISLLFLVQRTFYALGDTRTPFFFTLFQGALFSALVLVCALLPSSMIAAGIALATAVAGAAQLLLAVYLLRKKIGPLDSRRITVSILRYIAAGIPAVVAGWLLLVLLGGTVDGGFAVSSRLTAILAMAAIGCLMAIVYLGLLRLIRSPELTDAIALVSARFSRSS